MDNKRVISIITRAGIVILTTMAGFAVMPPVISMPVNSIINWKNAFILISGIISILIYDQFSFSRTKYLGFYLSGILIGLIVTYEMLVEKYSVVCFEIRNIVSTAPVKTEEIKKDSIHWATSTAKPPLVDFLQAYQCNSVDIWNTSDLYSAYYGILLIYFSMVIVLTILLVYLADLIKKQ